MGDHKFNAAVERMISIWGERKAFSQTQIDSFMQVRGRSTALCRYERDLKHAPLCVVCVQYNVPWVHSLQCVPPKPSTAKEKKQEKSAKAAKAAKEPARAAVIHKAQSTPPAEKKVAPLTAAAALVKASIKQPVRISL